MFEVGETCFNGGSFERPPGIPVSLGLGEEGPKARMCPPPETGTGGHWVIWVWLPCFPVFWNDNWDMKDLSTAMAYVWARGSTGCGVRNCSRRCGEWPV